MVQREISLFDRAKGNIYAAKLLLNSTQDELIIDLSAYHCQQCVEKIIKFLIELAGKEYNMRHDLYIVMEDLEDEEVKNLVEPVLSQIGVWVASTRYGKSIKSSRKQVERVLEVCEKLIELAKSRMPKPANIVKNIDMFGSLDKA